MKVVINRCFGGFSLSEEAYEYLGIPWDGYGFDYTSDSLRSNPELIACVEALGDRASGRCASLKVVEIPDGIEYEICEYDGLESIHEKYRVWK